MDDEAREALDSMCWQFAYRSIVDGKKALATGGLSALEEAFDALGWDDVHFVDDEAPRCAEKGCTEWTVMGVNTPDGYKLLCSDHGVAFYRAQRQAEESR